MSEKKISIIIPHYNSWELLDKLIGTIPVDEAIEIIVVDDNSSLTCSENVDNTIKNRSVKLIKNTYGKGPGSARNVGLDNATGEWILFADADDYFLEDAFDIILKLVEEYSNDYNDTTDIVYFPPTSLILETGKEGNRHKAYADLVDDYIRYYSCCSDGDVPDKEMSSDLHLRYDFNVLWSKLYRRCVIGDLRFEDLLIGEDVWFCTKVAANARDIAAVNTPIYCVTENEKSLTAKPHPEVFEKQVDVAIRRSDFLKERLTAEDYKLLHVNGKGSVFAAKAIGGMGLAFKTWRKLSQAGVKTFYISDLGDDIKKAMSWKKSMR